MARHDATAGFTLIEVAIALAVVVIGVLAVFALISTGLGESGEAVAETNGALFADSVFNTLGQRSQTAAKMGVVTNGPLIDLVYWRKFWADFATGQINLTVAAAPVWMALGNPRIASSANPVVWGDDKIYTNRYATIAQHAVALGGITNAVLRYRITVSPVFADLIASEPLSWKNFANTNVTVRLLLWDGQFGGTNNQQEYYAEFDNPGDL